jgi:tRNA (guanine-N7-)-methyltransferase
MKFRLPREATLEEPDVEIEFDDYRSYKRSKRTPKTAGK